ncbi:MAG: lipopolysaccharide biosynthesis protein [Gammaproteobacteria bacterium]|nr:lipopolysaccharide biosynthesis protein [Gammaproteobacteria bacterium]
MEQDASTLNDYVATFRRRKFLILSVAFFVMLIFVAVTFSLPAVYRSTGTILIEQQDIPDELVQSTVSSYANERIQIVSQRAMSRENLEKIVEEHNLYPEERAVTSMDTVVDIFRASTLLEPVSAEIVDPRTGRSSLSTIAFTLSYDNELPEKARDVARDLAQLYLDENDASRTEAAEQASAFLAERASQLEEEITKIESALADFKEQHGNSLPSVLDLNRERLLAVDTSISETEGSIRALRDSRNLLQSELAVTDPYESVYGSEGELILSPEQQLAALQREYAALSARYSENHPNLVTLRKQIAQLSGGDAFTSSAAIDAELEVRRAELAEAQQKYSADHPDVTHLTRLIEGLESQKANLSEEPAAAPQINPTSPLYVQKQGQLNATINELRAGEARLQELQSQRADYEERLMSSPQIEREYTALQRRYESGLQQYREIQDKERTAQLSASLESSDKGERFALVEPPTVPTAPVSPNRMALLILGFVLAAGMGMGIAAIVEAMDSSVRGAKDVFRLFDMPPLASIPYVENHADVRRRVGRNIITAGVAAFSIAVVAVIIQVLG